MSESNGHQPPADPSAGHDCDDLCTPASCKCPPCNCPEHLDRTARAARLQPDVEDVAPRPGPPESLF